MPTPLIGYSIASVAALKAIDGSNRTDGYMRLLLNHPSGRRALLSFVDASTATDDNFYVFEPSDLPANGRWLTIAFVTHDLSQQFTATQGVDTETVAFASPTAFNLSTSNTKRMDLTGATSITYSNAKDATYIFEFDQGGAGGHVITAGAGVVFADGATQTTTANYINLYSCKYDPTDAVLRCTISNFAS